MSDDNAIDITGLVKRFGRVRALDGLDLRVARGEIHGFLGPNGAGKSTTIRVLLGMLRADAGRVRMLGGDPWRDSVALHRRIAYVPGDVSLWPNLSGGEAIDMIGRMRGGFDPARRDALLERFRLDPGKRISSYSKGNRQKVALVAALAADAELYLLDEPTAGLDPLMNAAFAESIRDAVASGATVLLSSHVLAEVEELCERVTIIRDGRTIETGSLAEMRHATRTTITVTTASAVDGLDDMDEVHDLTRLDEAGTRLRFAVDAGHIGAVLDVLARHDVRELVSTPPSLEELFAHYYHEHDEVRA